MSSPTVTDLIETLRRYPILEDRHFDDIVERQSSFADGKQLLDELIARKRITPYQSDMLLRGKAQELIMGSYILLEPRGEGGMGKVFKAYHSLMRRTVAIKIMRHDLFLHSGLIERFHREIQAVANLRHPNIVVAYDANQEGDKHFLVMEYLQGKDLSSLVREKGTLPIGNACEYARQVAKGLEHIHEHGMIHRDIKPSNLMLTSENHQPCIKILDLGLVRFLAPLTPDDSVIPEEITRLQTPMGTPAYVAPEQVFDAHNIDIRADIYSLGCTLYYVLTGQPAYPRTGDMSKWLRHERHDPRPVRELNPMVPPDLSVIVAKMMQKNAGDRFQNPTEVVDVLTPLCQYKPIDTKHRVPANGPESSEPPTTPYLPAAKQPELSGAEYHTRSSSTELTGTATDSGRNFTNPTRKQKARMLIAFWSVGLLIVAFIIMGLAFMGPINHRTKTNTAQAKNKTTGKKTAGGKNSNANQAGAGKSTSKIPDLPVGELVGFSQHGGWVYCAAFFPGGKEVLSGGAEEILAWNAETGAVNAKVKIQMRGVKSLAVSPDGKFVIAGGQEKGEFVGLWNLSKKPQLNQLNKMQPHTETVHQVAISHDGKKAASASAEHEIVLWDAKTGTVLHTLKNTEKSIVRIGFAAGDNQLMVVCWNGSHQQEEIIVRFLDVSTGKETKRMQWSCPRVSSAAFAPDGKTLLLGYVSGIIELRKLDQKGSLVREYLGHSTPVRCLAFSPDGKRFLSSGGITRNRKAIDCCVRYWKVNEQKELKCFTKHTGIVNCIAFSDDGKKAVSASQDKSLIIWGLPK